MKLPVYQSADLLGLPFNDLAMFLDRLGVGARHTGRVFRGLHYHDQPLDQIQDLGRHAGVIAKATQRAAVQITEKHTSPEGTEKLVFTLDDGARIEGVLIPMRTDRTTLCVSSQVGCAMACTFCATGTMGLSRGLTAGEIIAQIHAARAHSERPVTHVVFMGMGEPLHHYPATRDAIRVLLDDHGMNYQARRITVSTVGVVPKIRQFADDFGGRVQLAISLHAGTDVTRRRIIPLAQSYSMAQLKAVCAAYPLPGRRVLMIEYVVLPGINDTKVEIDGLIEWTRDLRCVVNLIPFNPFPGAEFRSPTEAEVLRVGDQLQAARVPHSIRWPRGRSVAGACGQLASARPAQG